MQTNKPDCKLIEEPNCTTKRIISRNLTKIP